MRSGISAGLMGVGGIFLSFGVTILIIAFFTRTSSMWRDSFPTEMSTATGFLVVGGVMFVLGWLLQRGRRRDARAAA
ncbi:MAG TPA: hypothetical protein VFP26_13155 [Gemmatimonadaceae bacterium]|jgi:hypothetical protein|nr:hypothetical protein [Gemmatimonadaceae bacterium]